MSTDIHIFAEIYNNNKWNLSKIKIPRYRDYNSFAILANIRNELYTGKGKKDEKDDKNNWLIPISESKGLPEDISKELQNKYFDDRLGDNSYSYITLKEMIEYDLKQKAIQSYYTTKEDAKKYRSKKIIPRYVCSNMSGNDPDHNDYEYVEVEQSLDAIVYLFPKIIKKLKSLGSPENVRIVFGFCG